MSFRRILLIVILATTLHAQTSESGGADIQEVIKQISNGQIARVIIFQATGILTNKRMAPITLTYGYTQKVEYQIRTQAQKDALILLLKNLKVSKSTRGADVRVGIIFAGTQPIENREDWKYGIFSDEFGNYGYMGRIGKDWQLDDRAEKGIQISRDLWDFASQLFATIDH